MFRSHRSNDLPENDVVRLTFRNRTGQEYAVEIPWVSKADTKCLQTADTESIESKILKDQGVDEYQIEFEKLYKPHQRSTELEPLTDGSLELIGYRAGQRGWRAMQDFRFIPEATVLQDGDQIALDFSVPSIAPVVVYTSGADLTEGWSAQNGRLKAGLGDSYPDNMDTEASLFLDLTGRTNPITLAFDVEGKTEKDYDFFMANIYSADGKMEVLPPISGDIPQQKVSKDLSAFNGKKIEIRLRFYSDSIVSERGVSIFNLKVGSAAP